MKILFSGGGTLGPVTPLMAIIEELRSHDAAHEFLWIGTERGVELPLLRKAGIDVVTIPCGKLRRYFDVKNITDLWQTVRGFFQAWRVLGEFKPDVVVTAGGFVSVPVHYAAWLRRAPTLVHQQDVRIGLANKLMSWVAQRVTVSLESQLMEFPKGKAVLTGNPVRPSVLAGSRDKAIELFHLDPQLATVFVFGGGTGAQTINRVVEGLVQESGGQFQIIHLTGTDRQQPTVRAPYYHPYPFFTGEMAHAYAVADVVVGRAGFNTITEIAAWGKPSVLIPIMSSHQEDNAHYVAQQGAGVVLDEIDVTAEKLLDALRAIFADDQQYGAYAAAAAELMPRDARERVTREIELLAERSA